MQIDKIPFKKRRGRIPTSVEYRLGSSLAEIMKEGDSVFIPNESGINFDKLRIRLIRLFGEGSFSIQKETERRDEKEIEIKLGIDVAGSEIVKEEGFRVYRLK